MHRKHQRDITLFIVDVFVAIAKIKEYTEPFSDGDAFRHSSMHWDASIRQLEVIGEALNNLLEDEYFASVSPKYFRKIVNFRNVIAHGYFGIDAEEVWDVIVHKLTLLDKDLRDVVNGEQIDLSLALKETMNEYTAMNDKSIINYLRIVWKLS